MSQASHNTSEIFTKILYSIEDMVLKGVLSSGTRVNPK